MSLLGIYYTLPLAILRSGTTPADALENAIAYGTVNTGFGYLCTHVSPESKKMLAQATDHVERHDLPTALPQGVSQAVWNATLVGWLIHNKTGGDPVTDAQTFQQHHHPGEVFFKIRWEWLTAAFLIQLQAEGHPVDHVYRPLSWREFRLLAALLSAKVNKQKFVFLGWESLQARACGYHNKRLFRIGRRTLPLHCQPLTRDMIRGSLDRMEALRFFARCRYSTGTRGGLMAYSFRHKKREDLLAAGPGMARGQPQLPSQDVRPPGHRPRRLPKSRKPLPNRILMSSPNQAPKLTLMWVSNGSPNPTPNIRKKA